MEIKVGKKNKPVKVSFFIDTATGNYLTLGEAVRKLRTSANLTLTDFASRTGLSVRAISRIEQGLASVPMRQRARFLGLFNLTVSAHLALLDILAGNTELVSSSDSVVR